MPLFSTIDDLPDTFAGTQFGTGLRPAFNALWHLEALGVIDDLENPETTAWTEQHAKEPAQIALIDTPVDYHHPNLKGAIDLARMRDFSVAKGGVFPVAQPSETDTLAREAFVNKLKTYDSDVSQRILKSMRHEIQQAPGPQPVMPITFGAHGTAMAGLIGARPSNGQLRKPAYLKGKGTDGFASEAGTIDLPYCGVNPFCQITPVSISAVPDPKMLRAAVLYTRMLKPTLVVIADSWDFPQVWKDIFTLKVDEREAAREKLDPSQATIEHDWESLRLDFLELCKETIVLCAAGNTPLEKLVIPACWSKDSEGPWAVGACDEIGEDLSYSPPQAPQIKHGARMISTLSSEVPRYDRKLVLHDTWDRLDKELKVARAQGVFPFKDLVTTDLRGRAGYNPSEYDINSNPNEYYEIASLYCRFAGTSAATAIAAGLVSLVPGITPGRFNNDENLAGLFTMKKAMALFGPPA